MLPQKINFLDLESRKTPFPAFSSVVFSNMLTKENAVVGCLAYPSLVLLVAYRVRKGTSKLTDW